jgi:cytochrome c-type biogenesis protein CcmH
VRTTLAVSARRSWRAVALAACIAAASAADAARAEPAPSAPEAASAEIPGVAPGPAPADDDAAELARLIGSELRCPVCQGLSVADSTSTAAVAMQRRIEAFVRAGYSRDDIHDYFIGKYGEWVLLAPRNEGLNRLVWLGPGIAFLIGLGVAASMLRRGGDAPAEVASDPDDDYTRALLAEVERD